MDTKAEMLRDEAWHYSDLRLRITDERAPQALTQLIAEKEEQLLELEKEVPEGLEGSGGGVSAEPPGTSRYDE